MNFLIQFIVGVVLSIASTLLKQAFSKPEEKRTGTRGSAQVGGKVPQYFLVGTVGEPGKFEYGNEWGEVGGVPNAHAVDVYSFGDIPVTGLVGLFVNGVRVSISAAGLIDAGYPVSDYSGHMWAKFYDGTQSAPDIYLTSKFGADAERPWLADMIGRGVPYLITTSLWSEGLFTGFPSFLGEFEGIKLYDPRKDGTAGGVGPQRWAGAVPTPAEQATWEFSDNNAVIIYNIERGIYYEGRHIWGGKKVAAELPHAVWAAAMDACDLVINKVDGGTERQFRGGRRISLNERPADVIKEFLIGANARISHASDGMVYILVGVPTAPDFHFTDADILASEPLGSIPFPNLDEVINGVAATYREPMQAWGDKETAPYFRADLSKRMMGERMKPGWILAPRFRARRRSVCCRLRLKKGGDLVGMFPLCRLNLPNSGPCRWVPGRRSATAMRPSGS